MSKNKAYTHVSLFSGAGGLDIGLEQAGFHTVWANDFNHDACETHRLWSNATVVEGDIGKVDYDTIPDCDIASFGFPCQGFSLSGLRKVDDSRNVLYRHCVKLVEKKQPKLFLAENVKGLLTLGSGKIKDAIIADFESKGYAVSINLVNAADYHVPEDVQDREFYTSQNVCVLHTDDHSITERAKWFVSASITASCGNYEAFTDELNRHIRTDFIIRLPVDKTGQPDWAYMEEYMRKVEERVKKTINTFCVIRNIKFDC